MSRIARTESVGDSLCPVCHEHTEIYAIGPCDHPICYRCSTRMRVLCGQMECPICRGDLPQIVFFTSKRKYDEVDRRNCIPNRKYKILLEDESVEDAYEALLEHRCRTCNDSPLFDSFGGLRQHMSRSHTLFPCQLCVDHLKIFPFERKFYSRKDLAIHRRSGDSDNRSYRGHPLCRFCDERYMDNDELLRHLRKSHYFCHICDTNCSNNEYFSDYPDLKQHFRSEHFLCEEDQCGLDETRFTNAFASEIDLKAHKAATHMGSKSKAQSREMRTIDVNFQMAPRRRGRDNAGVVTAEDYEELRGSNRGHRDRRQRRNDSRFESYSRTENGTSPPNAGASAAPEPPPALEDDFPTLGNGPAPFIPSSQKKPAQGEDFPSLSAQRPAGLVPSTLAAFVPRPNRASMTSGSSSKPSNNFSSASSVMSSAGTARPSSAQNASAQAGRPAQAPTVTKNSWTAPRLSSGEDFPSLKDEKKGKPVKDGPNYVSLGAWTKKQKEDGSKQRPASSRGRQSPSVASTPSSLVSLGRALCDDGEFPSLGSNHGSKQTTWMQKNANPNKKTNSKGATHLGNSKDTTLINKKNKDGNFVLNNGALGSTSEETKSKKSKKKQRDKGGDAAASEDSGISLSSIASEIDAKAVMSQPISDTTKEEKNVIEHSSCPELDVKDAKLNSLSSAVKEAISEHTEVKEENKKSTINSKVSQELDAMPQPAGRGSVQEGRDKKKHRGVSEDSKAFQDDDFPSLRCASKKGSASSSEWASSGGKENKKNTAGVKKSNGVEDDDFPSLRALPRKTAPPPGFQKSAKAAAPPPGIVTPTPSLGRTPPGLGSCTPAVASSATTIPMSVKLNMYSYIPPVDGAERNSALVSCVRKLLILKDGGFDQFRALSGEFRSSQVTAQAYHKQCQDLFGPERLLEVLPELIALLPDILKQQELAEAHKQDILGICSPLSLSSCPTCHQLLKQEDYTVHIGMHANVIAGFSGAAFPVKT